MTRGVFARRLALGHVRLLLVTQLRRERLDLGVLGFALGFLSLGSRLECSKFSCGILSRDLHLSRKNLGRSLISSSTL